MIQNGIHRSNFIDRSLEPGNIDISVFIPVYNGAKSLPELFDRLEPVMQSTERSYEYVLLDDGSSDNSWQVINGLNKALNNVCAIRHMKNLGYNFSLQHGLEYCRGEWVVTLDDDLQHLPEEIPKLLKAADSDKDVDVFFGSFYQRQHKSWRNLGSTLYLKIIRALYKLPKNLYITSFRLINRRVVDQIIHSNLAEPQAGFMILKITQRIKNVDVEHGERKYGSSGIRLSKMIRLTFDMILHHTTLPLQLITILGAISLVISFSLAFYYLCSYYLYQTVLTGFTTVVLLVLAFGGLSLFGIGIVGFYVSRLLQQVTFSAVYSVRQFLPPTKDKQHNDR